jgi:tRNA-splicing ligase RtcB (3'-phosphate/5'-hydroxy nucleic acid ligase)
MASSHRALRAVRRLDQARAAIDNPYDIPITLIAGEGVSIEAEGLDELLRFASLEGTLRQLGEAERRGQIAPFWGGEPGRIDSIVLTPDFHKGSGIPVGTVVDARGFVVPRAVGNDVCCGMRLLVTDATRDELASCEKALSRGLRALFFQGKRDIPMSPRQREALLRDGLWGLLETAGDNEGTGAWRGYDRRAQEDDLERVHFTGALPARGTFAFDRFIRASGARDGRDPQIGSVGGGNHFVELQSVEDIHDGGAARAFGLARGQITVMVHSGSVGVGHMVGGHFGERARSLFPRGINHPGHGFYALPSEGPLRAEAAAYLDAMRNAANFAFGNRLFLGLMAVRAMSEAIGRQISARLVYDAPHNLVWPDEAAGRFLHRKGATPALGPDAFRSPFRYAGHPVIIPGSMGASSFVLAGLGNTRLLESACHGAGRCLTRGQAGHLDDDAHERSASGLHVVTPIDPDAPHISRRRDILARYRQRLKEESPLAYKPITPVVESVERAGVARRVARLWPMMTVKG